MRLPNLEDIQINIEQGIVTKKNVHTYWDPFVREFPDHGWKIHISCYLDNYQEILSIISNFCFAENYSFKFVNDTNILKFLLSKSANRTESGKFITIYPFNENEFVQIIRKLYPLVNNMVGPYILSDKRYLDSKVIYYRYGIISGEDSIMHFKDGTVNDDRLPYYNLPKYVQDPLHENVEKDNNSNNVLEKNYTNISAIHFSNSGGIYSAFNKVRQKEVVLKEARPYIGISTYNDSIICRKREQYYFDLFKENNLTPKLYSEFYEWEHYFIEVEKIEGITFKNFIDSNTLVGLKESDKLEINKRMKKNLILINKLLSAFKIFQSKGLIVNDISENNIIIDKDLNPIFIDLEDAYSIDEVWPGKYDMKNEYLEDERKENLSYFKKDIHKLGYLLMSLLSNSNHLLKEDITGSKSMISFEYFCSIYNLNSNIFNTIQMMIHGKYNSLEDIEHVLIQSSKPHNYELLKFKNFINKEYKYDQFTDIGNLGLALLLHSDNIISSKIINFDLIRLEEMIKNKQWIDINNFMKTKKFNGPSLNKGFLEEMYLYYFLFEQTKNERYLLILEDKLISFSQKYIGIYNLIEDENKCAIPYISHTAGFTKLLLKFLKYKENHILNKIVPQTLEAIDRNYPKELGYYNGIAGIADTLLDAYIYTKDIKYFESVKIKVQIMMTFHTEKKYDFCSGNEGINYFYYKLSKHIRSEQNEKYIY